MKARITPRNDVSSRLDAIEKRLREIGDELDDLSEFESRTEAVVERKVYEIKALAYVTLIIASVLLALVLGMTINALGIRLS